MAYRASKVITAYFALLVASVFLTYGLAVGSGHVAPFVPFVGFLGDQPLESTVFTQLFVAVAAVLAFIVQIQYVSVSALLEARQASAKSFRANAASVYVGYLSASGLFVLACFQESHAYHVHHAAELLFLSAGVVYCALQTVVSRREKDARTGVRVFLNAFMLAFFLAFLIGYVFAMRQFDRPWEQRYHWGRSDGGWLSYIISAASEWVLVCLFHVYLLTFYPDFQCALLTKTSIVVLSENRGVT